MAKEHKEYKTWNQSRQICWRCRKACGGCSWSARLEPVEGWTAIRRDVHNNNIYGGDMVSYQIIFCPQFEPDKKKT